MEAEHSIFRDPGAWEGPPDDDLVRSVEQELGVRLPPAYVELCRAHNGGNLARSAHPAHSPTRGGGDPSVHVDQEVGYRITPIAPDFASFLDGLVPVDQFQVQPGSCSTRRP